MRVSYGFKVGGVRVRAGRRGMSVGRRVGPMYVSDYTPYRRRRPATRSRRPVARTQPAHPRRFVAPSTPRRVGVAYLLAVLLGLVGGHRYYLGLRRSGVAYTLTLGWLGVGVLVDLLVLVHLTRRSNRWAGFAA
jgi:hypothetical protein